MCVRVSATITSLRRISLLHGEISHHNILIITTIICEFASLLRASQKTPNTGHTRIVRAPVRRKHKRALSQYNTLYKSLLNYTIWFLPQLGHPRSQLRPTVYNIKVSLAKLRAGTLVLINMETGAKSSQSASANPSFSLFPFSCILSVFWFLHQYKSDTTYNTLEKKLESLM